MGLGDDTGSRGDGVGESADSLGWCLRGGRPEFGSDLRDLRRRLAVATTGAERQINARYRVTGILGTGSYGVVYRAHDRRLDRAVAIKILNRASAVNVRDALREAQMLAAVSHPNIVEVFEVGLTEDDARSPFVVMELVEGVSLRELFETGSLSPAEVLDIVGQAARGLHAAHEAGLLHRDFKPANVLVSKDGQARVADFGLARELGAERTDGPSAGSGLVDGSTAESLAVGTPAYMAPECFAGKATRASDQYSLCAVLFEGLVGRRAAKGPTVSSLAHVVRTKDVVVPRSAGVPRALARVIERGMHRRPASRFSDLPALLAALERARRPPRWPSYAACFAVLGMLGVVPTLSSERDAPCRAEAIPQLVPATEGLHAEVAARLTSYEQELQDAAHRICAGPEREEGGGATQCLQARAMDAAALADVSRELAWGDHAKILEALAGLAAPSECLDGDTAPVPVELVEGVAALQSDVSRLRAMMHAAQIEQGRALAGPVLERARALGYAPLHVEVAQIRGRFESLASNYEAAREALEESYFVARDAELFYRAAGAATHLMGVVGRDLDQPDEGRRWAEFAAAAYARAGQSPLQSRTYIQGLAYLAVHDQDYAELERLARAGIELEVGKGQVGDQGHITMLGFLGMALTYQERYEESLPVYEEGEQYSAAYYGEQSVARAAMIDGRANGLRELGRTEEALALSLKALELREATYTSDNVDLGYSHGNIGLTLKALGRFDSAVEHATAALKIFEKLLAPDHPTVALGYQHRAGIHAVAGHTEEAIADYRRALASLESGGRADSDDAAELRQAIADLEAGDEP